MKKTNIMQFIAKVRQRLVLLPVVVLASAFMVLSFPTVALADVQTIDTLDEYHELINSDVPIAINFWATRCVPCRRISPIFEELSKDTYYKGRIKFFSVDVDEHSDISQESVVTAMPTFMTFKNGQKLGEVKEADSVGLEALLAETGMSDRK